MKLIAVVTGGEGGRMIRMSLPFGEIDDGAFLSEIMVATDAGDVLVNLPLQLSSGVPWPPLPFQDFSVLSAEYRRKVMEAERGPAA